MNPITPIPIPLLLALLLALTPPPARAAMRWMDIPDTDLATTASTIQPGAPAEILYRFKQIDDSSEGRATTDEYIRIKIYNDNGAQALAKVDIPYDKKTDTITAIAARVIKPGGAIIEVEKKAFYDREIVKLGNLRLHVRSFALPSLEPGAIVEYRWTTVQNSNVYFPRIDLLGAFPSRRVVFRAKMLPLRYGTKIYYNRCAQLQSTKAKDGFTVIEARDMPAAIDEPYMPPADDTRPWIMFYPAMGAAAYNWNSYARDLSDALEKRLAAAAQSQNIRDTARRISQMPSIILSGPNIQGDLDALQQQMTSLRNTLDNARTKQQLDQVARTLATMPATPGQKLARLCDFCRATIINIDHMTPQGGVDPKLRAKTNRTADDILKTKLATSADLQFLFIALARASGFDARPALCSNRTVGRFRKDLLSPGLLPDPIVAVKLNGTWLYYDPAHCLAPSGKLRWQNSPATALIILPNGIDWQTTPPPTPEDSLVKRTGTFRLTEDGTLFGEVRLEYGDIAGADAREKYFLQTQEKIEETLRTRLQERLPLAEISDITALNSDNPLKPFTLTYSVKVPAYAETTGQRQFLQPNFFEKGKPPMFTADTRAAEIAFNYPINETDTVTMTLPPWLQIEEGSAPENFEKSDWGKYLVKITLNKKTHDLTYTRDFTFTLFTITAQGYAPLKSLLNKIHERDSHTLTLRPPASAQ